MLTLKWFPELSGAEVYEILKTRSEIFMLEQNIRCLDMDDVDYRSLHCFYSENGRVTAYLRAFYQDEEQGIVRIGRVVTLVHGRGDGRHLMEESLAEIPKKMHCSKCIMDAQSHASGFYEKLGFAVTSEEFLEEGIPHVVMECEV